MKIIIYELLGLVKDGKAPKKIKYEYLIYELTPERNDYYCKNEMKWFTNEINSLGVLNDEVEIIEESKKIEHCLKRDRFLRNEDEIEHLRTKIDELIDEINNLKGEK